MTRWTNHVRNTAGNNLGVRSHYMMCLAYVFNTPAGFSSALAQSFRELGVRGFIGFDYYTLTGPWLVPEEVKARLNRPFQLRLE